MDTEDIDSAINSNISRIVAALAVPIGAVVAAVLAWLQNSIGIDLQNHTASITAFVGTIILGFAYTAAKWLEGRKEFEKLAAIAVQGQVAPTPELESDPIDIVDDDEGAEGEVAPPEIAPTPERQQGFE